MSSTQTKICFFLYSLDVLSGPKNFKIFNREKNVSLVGLIFTIILIMIIILYTVIELIEYFKLANFSLNSMEDNSEKIDATKYIGNETIVAIRFMNYYEDELNNKIEIDIPDILKIFKIKVEQYNYIYETDKYDYKSYIMENCTNYLTDNDLKKFNLPRYYIEQSVCPPNNKGLKLRWNKYESSSLIFRVYLCNKNEDKNCYSEEEINEKYENGELDNIAFGFIREFNIIDNYNFSNPLKIDSLISQKYINLARYFIGEVQTKYIYYESDIGIFFTNIKNYTGLKPDTFIYNYKNRENIIDYKTPLLSISYSINLNNILNYKRTYSKLTTVIVDIAGITRVLFLIGRYAISLLSENYFSYKLFEEIFSQKYRSTNPNEIKKNIHNDINFQISSNKNILKENKIHNIPEDSKISSENNSLKIKTKKQRIKKGKLKKNIISNKNIIINEGNSDNTNLKIINNDNNIIKKSDDEQYSIILSKYLGYDEKNKKKFSFWAYIFSLFNKKNDNMRIINSCAKMINNYLSLEKIITNGINVDILLTNYELKEINYIDILNRIIDNDFKNAIKNIKEKKG